MLSPIQHLSSCGAESNRTSIGARLWDGVSLRSFVFACLCSGTVGVSYPLFWSTRRGNGPRDNM